MKTIFTFLFLISIACNVFAQFELEFSSGIGTYSMGDLQQLNDEMLRSLPVEARITDDFPAQPFFNAAIFYSLSEKTSVGINCSYHSSGSRISYKDYSGELRIDNVVSAYSPGLVLGFKLLDKRIKLVQENNVAFAFSHLKMEEETLNQKNDYKLKSFSPQFEPRLKASFNIRSFSLGTRAGYLVDFKGKTKFDKLSGDTVQNKNDEDIKTDWSGFRLAAFLAYRIK